MSPTRLDGVCVHGLVGCDQEMDGAGSDAFERRRADIEQRPVLGFPLAAYRRFQEVEGKHLALVIGVNMFIAIIPLVIVGYAILEAFNPHRSFGTVLVGRFRLSGNTATIVRDTFASARGGESVALSIGLISLVITGVDIARTVGTAYAARVPGEATEGDAAAVAGRRLADCAARDDVVQSHRSVLGIQPAVVVPRVGVAGFVRRDLRFLPGYSATCP